LLLLRPAAPARTSRFAISVPAAEPVDLGSLVSLGISPDGNRIAYRVRSGGDNYLASRSMAQFNALTLPETKTAGSFTLSPDGQWLAFSAFGGPLKKIAVDGGSATTLTDLAGPAIGLDWYGDTIYFNRNFSAGIWSVPAAGGTPRQVIRPDAAKGQRAIVWPQMLPGGKAILATIWTGGSWDDAKLAVFPLQTGQARIVVEGGTYGRYADSGHIIFGRGTALYAVPFDIEKLETTGTPVPIVRGVASG
jgi:serine/threonine-protein kinase